MNFHCALYCTYVYFNDNAIANNCLNIKHKQTYPLYTTLWKRGRGTVLKEWFLISIHMMVGPLKLSNLIFIFTIQKKKYYFFLINSENLILWKCSDCSFSGKVGRLTDCGATVPSIKKTLYIYCAQKFAHGVGLTKLI